METLIKDDDGRITFLIECDPDKKYSIDFTVWKVTTWKNKHEPDHESLERFIKGEIKWDGCSHIYFGDENGYLHLCGRGYFDNMKNVLDAVWAKAEREIEHFDKFVAS